MENCQYFQYHSHSLRSKYQAVRINNGKMVKLLNTMQGYQTCNVHLVAIVYGIYSRPKPSAFSIAVSNFSRIVFFDLYAGNTNWLKHVWAIGNLLREELYTNIQYMY